MNYSYFEPLKIYAENVLINILTQNNVTRSVSGDRQYEHLAVNRVLSGDHEWFCEANLAGQFVVVHVNFQGVDHCAGETHDLDVLKL